MINVKYDVYIENKNLIFDSRRKTITFPLSDVVCFNTAKINNDAMTTMFIGGKPYFMTKKEKDIHYNGTIIIGLKTCNETIKQKRNYKKVIKIYDSFAIKNVSNVFDVAEKLIDLKIKYNDILKKEVFKYDNEGNQFYNYTLYN